MMASSAAAAAAAAAAAGAGAGGDPVATTGQLSEAEFQVSMAMFCDWWQESFPAQPPWVVQSVVMPVTGQVVQYVQLERLVPVKTTAQQQQQQQQQRCHVHKYSVVWQEIYRVPVLYIAACRPDGCPLTLSELCEALPQLQDYQDSGQASWTYITATAHPVTGGPSFMLHPCQTAVRMQLLLQQEHVQGCAGSAPAATEAAAGPPAQAGTAADAAGDSSDPPLSAEATLLLKYAWGWFSMVAPLLGLSMLPL